MPDLAATRPYVDRPVGDVSAATAAAKIVAVRHRLEAPQLMRIGMNALFAAGDVVIRVGRPSASGQFGVELAQVVGRLGVLVPEPIADAEEIDGLTVTLWRLVEATAEPVDWVAVGAIVRQVHEIDPGELPDGYPLPLPASFPWWDFDAAMTDLATEIDTAARDGLTAAIASHRNWTKMDPTRLVVCHGDVHPGNVLMSRDGPVLLDWDLMCRATPQWDHAMLLTLAERWGGDPGVYPSFARGYGESFEPDSDAQALATLRNVAATLMRVRAGRTDPAARAEASRRLQYWRGEPDAPSWSAQ